MNIPVIILFVIVLIVLIIFLIARNQKDKKQLEDKLNNEFHKSKDEEDDIETEAVMK
jgi:preprotein translocase subunit YajC